MSSISAQSGVVLATLYDMKIIEDPGNDGFQRIDIGGIDVLVHNKDSSMLSGINIDFKETLMGGVSKSRIPMRTGHVDAANLSDEVILCPSPYKL